jgi:hypothetical protein
MSHYTQDMRFCRTDSKGLADGNQGLNVTERVDCDVLSCPSVAKVSTNERARLVPKPTIP